jgi:hypothetical protein
LTTTECPAGVYARVTRQLDTIRVRPGSANGFLDVPPRRVKSLNGHSGVIEMTEQALAAPAPEVFEGGNPGQQLYVYREESQ